MAHVFYKPNYVFWNKYKKKTKTAKEKRSIQLIYSRCLKALGNFKTAIFIISHYSYNSGNKRPNYLRIIVVKRRDKSPNCFFLGFY